MSGFFKSLKAQIKDEVVRMVQPPPQGQAQPRPYQAPQYQYPQQPHQPDQYGNSQGHYTHAPPPQTYQQNPYGTAPHPQYQVPPEPQNNIPPPQAPQAPQERQPYSTQPAGGNSYPSPPPGPPPVSQPTQPSGVRLPPGPPPGTHQNFGVQPKACIGRKAVLVNYNKFYVFKHSVFPRQDPQVQDLAFGICDGCYQTHISRYPGFIPSFEAYESPESSGADIPLARGLCDFTFPVVKDTFYKQCVPQNSLQALIKVAHECLAMSACPGAQLWEGGQLYMSPSIPNCTVCPRCYELYVKPSFGQYFKHEVRTKGDQWYCDLGKDPGFVYDILVQTLAAPNPDFSAFARAANDRLNIPPCPGDGKPLQPGSDGMVRLYSFQQANLGACSECYFDYIALSPFASAFVLSTHNPQKVTATCNLATAMSRFLMTKALSTSNISAWQTGLENFVKIPPCAYMTGVPEEDINDQQNQLGGLATWYSVAHCPNIEICPSCYNCVVCPLGAMHLFQPITRQLQAGAVRVCNFSIGAGGVTTLDQEAFPTTLHWRGFMLRTALDHLSEDPSLHKNWAPFLSLASMLNACGPPCGASTRGFKKPSGRRFFGHLAQNANDNNDCTVVMCEECYNDLVKETSLNTWLGNDLTDEVYRNDAPPWQKEGFCQPWSKTSKNILRQAAAANDFTIFARHWNHRLAVREQTLPTIALLRQQFHLQNRAKMSSYLNASMVQAGASFSEAAGTTGASYGNSVVGMGFHSYAGVDAAMWKRKADQTAWGDAGHLVKIAELERQWKEVE